ncbi:Hypothetical protein A7982_05983 [Minicystis rosea]|nr:Hypothetical protein A7982_05983 [Minicystis rosea]
MDAMCMGAWLAAGAAIALSVSCAPVTAMPDTDSIAVIVREAGESGGREDPAAAYYLALAERELARAEVQARVRDREGARSWARRARADAEMARLLAVEAAVRGAAQRAEDHAEALYREIEARR